MKLFFGTTALFTLAASIAAVLYVSTAAERAIDIKDDWFKDMW